MVDEFCGDSDATAQEGCLYGALLLLLKLGENSVRISTVLLSFNMLKMWLHRTQVKLTIVRSLTVLSVAVPAIVAQILFDLLQHSSVAHSGQ